MTSNALSVLVTKEMSSGDSEKKTVTKVKVWILDIPSAAYMRRLVNSSALQFLEVAADWRELMVPRRGIQAAAIHCPQ